MHAPKPASMISSAEGVPRDQCISLFLSKMTRLSLLDRARALTLILSFWVVNIMKICLAFDSASRYTSVAVGPSAPQRNVCCYV